MSLLDIVTRTIDDVVAHAGFLAVVVPLCAWLGKVWATRENRIAQHVYDRELQVLRKELETGLQRSRSELEKLVFVHRIQFEKEFSIYVELWSQLVEARRATLGLRPIFDHVTLGESEEDRRRARMQRFVLAYNSLLQVVDKHEPFIAEAVHATCLKLLELAQEEQTAYQYASESRDRDYWNESKENAQRFTTLTSAACNSIRQRISSMSVPESA